MADLCNACSLLTVLFLSVPFCSTTPVPGANSSESTNSEMVLGGSGTKQYYMSDRCGDPALKLPDRKAIRMVPWVGNHPSGRKDCVVSVQSWAYQNYQLTVTFNDMDLTGPSRSHGSCDQARLDLYSGPNVTPYHRLNGDKGLCGKYFGQEQFATDSNTLTLRFQTFDLHPNLYEYFEAVITPFHNGRCDHSEYRCSNSRCVDQDLVCDGYNNCGDNSDEENCGKLALSVAAIIGIVLGAIAFVAIVITVIVCCCCCGACCSVYESI